MAHIHSSSGSSALSQASAIARSASGAIDWFNEPLTERERKVRERYLQRFFDDDNLRSLVLIGIGLECEASIRYYESAPAQRSERPRIAMDMQTATSRAQSILDQRKADYEASEIADIMDEIDDEESD